MKKLLLGALLLLSTLGFGQKTSYSEVSKSTERIKGDFNEYESKNGTLYKVGDTIKIGTPSSNKTFAFITESTGAFGSLAGERPQNLSVSLSGTNTIIKRIYIFGTKRTGFKIGFIGKGVCSLCPQYYIDLELALETGEIKSNVLTSDEALAELKRNKDKLDLGLITQEEFDKIKKELSKYIK